ncbi:MAG: hypothetical protein ABR548_04055 [Actinomycetota bacterium]|nr:hypothetical protein [Actinomycetota bacterium]
MSALTERWAGFAPRERAVIIVLGIVVLLGLVYLIFFTGGGGPVTVETAPPTSGSRTPVPTASPTAAATPVPETFESFEGKDPFRPLIAAGSSGGSPPPAGTPAPQPTGTSSPSEGGPSGGQRVSLVDINTRNGTLLATVEVNGKSYTVKEGDTFAGSYRVLDLTKSCGTFVFGDERFTLCIGQEVLK